MGSIEITHLGDYIIYFKVLFGVGLKLILVSFMIELHHVKKKLRTPVFTCFKYKLINKKLIHI